MQNLDQQINSHQNTKCLEQQFYACQENFTPALLVMRETFRRSGVTYMLAQYICKYLTYFESCLNNTPETVGYSVVITT